MAVLQRRWRPDPGGGSMSGGFAVGDVTMDTIYQAMQGLQSRQTAIANNIANIQTPGFTASNVNFESSLQSAVATGNPDQTQITVSPSTDAPDQTGNNVNLDDQTVLATKTQEGYQTMIDAMNAKFQLLKDALSTSSGA
jgi:flagellar basal-body rod protein FlgB